jgi:hypothetical protein
MRVEVFGRVFEDICTVTDGIDGNLAGQYSGRSDGSKWCENGAG